MPPTELDTILSRLGLSQLGAARLLDIDGRTVRRWIAGEVPIPQSITLLFKAMAKYRISPEQLERLK
jgi:DNA-binding transcriptional regulator YiaG